MKTKQRWTESDDQSINPDSENDAFNIFINCIAVFQFRLQLHQVFNQLINRFNFQINAMKILADKVATDSGLPGFDP